MLKLFLKVQIDKYKNGNILSAMHNTPFSSERRTGDEDKKNRPGHHFRAVQVN